MYPQTQNPFVYLENGSLCIRGELQPGWYSLETVVHCININAESHQVYRDHGIFTSNVANGMTIGVESGKNYNLWGLQAISTHADTRSYDRITCTKIIGIADKVYINPAAWCSNATTFGIENRAWVVYLGPFRA